MITTISSPNGYQSTFRQTWQAAAMLADTTEYSRLIDQASTCVHRAILKLDSDREAALRLIHFACFIKRKAAVMMTGEAGTQCLK